MNRPNPNRPAPELRKCIYVFLASVLMTASFLRGQSATTKSADDPEARPPVTPADVQIVKRARQILNSSEKWNRVDNRQCPPDATTFSLYCAIEKATDEVSGAFEHRGAAMQEARFVIDVIRPDANYDHRLMDYNNDPKTTFADIQRVLDLLELDIRAQLRIKRRSRLRRCQPHRQVGAMAMLAVAPADIQVIERAIAILDSPSKWTRSEKQSVPPDGQPIGLYGALEKADREITGSFDDHCAAMKEARRLIDETAPNHLKYKARLVDYNNDPTTSFADIQKLLQTVRARLKQRLAAESGK